MAKVVLGLGTSHAPQLSTPPESWTGRAKWDQSGNVQLWYQGAPLPYAELLERRRGEGLAREVTPERWAARYAACQQAIAQLAETMEAANPDVVLMIGDDQNETFIVDESLLPAFNIHTGDTVENAPYHDPRREAMGIGDATWSHMPPERITYPCVRPLAEHIVRTLIAEGFDPAHSRKLPAGRHGNHSVGHAFGFVMRRVLNDRQVPNVPVFINTYYPPNQPTAQRCYAFGRALRRAIDAWDADQTVGIVTSGGLTHFVIEEDLDRRLLDAMRAKDHDALVATPEARLMSGNSEIKNWITLAGVMADSDLEMELIDYQPCYRTEAGTGCGMAFARWR